MDLKQTAENYFSNFENKDIDALSLMFHEEVTLRDWNIEAYGKKDVLDANKNIFDNIKDIKVNVMNLYVCDTNVIAELLINADDNEPLPVVDIICFDSNFKICSIRAFRGN